MGLDTVGFFARYPRDDVVVVIITFEAKIEVDASTPSTTDQCRKCKSKLQWRTQGICRIPPQKRQGRLGGVCFGNHQFSGKRGSSKIEVRVWCSYVDKQWTIYDARDAFFVVASGDYFHLSQNKCLSLDSSSIDELKSNMEMGRFFATLKRVQDYIRCVQSKDDDDMLAMVHLSVTAWEALCRFKTLEYKRAYKHAYQLRYGGLTHSQLAAPTSSTASNAEIKQAIEMQVQIAEQLTACQKKLYLVNRWKMRVLRKTKRASTFEPQGYQPIRCL